MPKFLNQGCLDKMKAHLFAASTDEAAQITALKKRLKTERVMNVVF